MEKTNQSIVNQTVGDHSGVKIDTNLGLTMEDRVQETTQLTAPASIQAYDAHVPPPFLGQNEPRDLIPILARPRLLSRGAFANGTVGITWTETISPNIISNRLSNLDGVYGWRGTICYRAEIAASPQAQGIVRLSYEMLPPPNLTTNNNKASLRALSCQQPGSEINLQTESALEVKIPYMFDFDFYPLRNSNNIGGSYIAAVSLVSYSGVSWDATSVSSPTWTIYTWFEDVELVYKAVTLVGITRAVQLPVEEEREPNLIAQAGAMGENDHKKISTWFTLASKVATLAGSVPILSSIATPVSWAFAAGAKIAAYYGWSKPVQGSFAGIMGMSYARGINTCADADFAQPMALYANNEVELMPNFAGKDIDEMSICYLTCKPGLITQLTLSTTDPAGYTKWTCPVSPAYFYTQVASNSSVFGQGNYLTTQYRSTIGQPQIGFLPSPICFVSSFFTKWRGDLLFRVKISSTRFHSGKIQLAYVPWEDFGNTGPYGSTSFTTPDTGRYDYHNIIIDLRTTTEVDFEVPFVYPKVWCNTGSTYPQNVSYLAPVPSTGVIIMKVIEPLFGPPNVPSSVPVLIEVLSKCGLEFSQPCTSPLTPMDMDAAPKLIAQAGMDDGETACLQASGERILSLKQIAMRPIWRYNAPVAGQRSFLPEASLDYHPANQWGGAAGGEWNHAIDTRSTIISKISSLYALHRGSLVYRAVPALTKTSGNKTAFNVTFAYAPATDPDIRSAAISLEGNVGNFVKLPFYSNHNRVRTGWNIRASNGVPNQNGNEYFLWNNIGGNDSPFLGGVAAGDDYQAGMFTGVPPMVYIEHRYSSANDPYLNVSNGVVPPT